MQEVQKRGSRRDRPQYDESGRRARNPTILQQLIRYAPAPRAADCTSGGAGTMEHFWEAFRDANVDGALAASVFHKQIINIGELKTYPAAQGVGD